MAKVGHIGVTTDNIFPVIKKFLLQRSWNLLRELVSNAVDATQKLKTLSVGEFKGELGDVTVRVAFDVIIQLPSPTAVSVWLPKRSKI